MKLGTQKPESTTPWFPVCYILHHIREYPLHDGKCSSGREIASSNVKGVFLADGTAKALMCFLLTTRNTSHPPKRRFQIESSLKQDRKIIPFEP
jgi:hypothetical protein